jgi:hypothetical protein
MTSARSDIVVIIDSACFQEAFGSSINPEAGYSIILGIFFCFSKKMP